MVMLLSEISKFKGAIQSVTFILTNADKFDEQYLDNCKNRLGFIVKNFKQFRANIQLPHDNSDKENLFLSETATEDDSQNLILVLNQNNSNYQKVNNIFYSAYHVVMQIRYIKHDKDYMHTCVIADLFPFYFKIKKPKGKVLVIYFLRIFLLNMVKKRMKSISLMNKAMKKMTGKRVRKNQRFQSSLIKLLKYPQK